MDSLARYMQTSKTAKQYWPERVAICEELPKTGSGKVQKFKLRERAIAFASDQA